MKLIHQDKTSKIKLKKIVFILVVISLMFLSVKDVNAIGVSPGRTTINYAPNLEQTVNFRVISNDNEDTNLVIFVREELNQSVTLYDTLVELKAGESKTLRYDVKLPSQLEEPGLHAAEIVIMELPKPLKGQTVIGANTAVVTQLYVNVPYPGKYARIDLSVSEAQVGEEVTFIVPVMNLGEEDIEEASATIDILGPTNEKIDTIETDEKSIESKDRRELTAKWKADVNPGVYHAIAVVDYDGKKARVEKNFGVGNLLIDIIDVNVKNFKLGGIAKFEINLESKWNQKIGNVFADVVMSDEDGDEISEFRSESRDINPLDKTTLFAYWDTEGVDEGVYDAKIILHYEGKTTEKHLRAFVSLDNIKFDLIGATGEVVGVGGLGRESVLGLLVVVLILINVGWFWYFSRRNKMGRKGEEKIIRSDKKDEK